MCLLSVYTYEAGPDYWSCARVKERHLLSVHSYLEDVLHQENEINQERGRQDPGQNGKKSVPGKQTCTA